MTRRRSFIIREIGWRARPIKEAAGELLEKVSIFVLVAVWPFNWRSEWRIHGTRMVLRFNNDNAISGLYSLGLMWLVFSQCLMMTVVVVSDTLGVFQLVVYLFMTAIGAFILWCNYVLEQWADEYRRSEWIPRIAARCPRRRVEEVLAMGVKEGAGVLRRVVLALPAGSLARAGKEVKASILRCPDKQVRIAVIGHMAGKREAVGRYLRV